MEPVVFVAIIAGLILLLLIVGAPLKPIRYVGQVVIKLVIGAVFLFFLNTLGNQVGIHVPINFVTSAIAGVLGIPGVAALAAIDYWVI
ncbi:MULTISPECIES: pro-sigmaK processing inhibitor BofA family protein [Peribacillus]|uniref:pro-sigmaK processing inhibitor BofA family protein n=1 Tax=Peribacillus TaxID=2675229 RepID=UPI002079A6AD|nr:pro-sigmaK processing inhibitor BofA family protein [Peribacillus asahii]USK59901.1 pro-sigmaK processing inhibitor BofA family protein [Peribacillus asahii]USK70343.1 pro-sigmaK processing inhibitor BofA family protein [Peribacillus asahii]